MSEGAGAIDVDEDPVPEGPATPDVDESYGPERDDPRAAGAFNDPYQVEDFDPANEERDMCGAE